MNQAKETPMDEEFSLAQPCKSPAETSTSNPSADEDDEDEYDEEEDGEEEDEEEEETGRVALALDLSQLSGGDGPPQNGHDYLHLVRSERQKYPAVTYAQPPPSTCPKLKQKVQINTPNLKYDDLKYRDEILNNFKKLRDKIEEIRELSQVVPDDPASSAQSGFGDEDDVDVDVDLDEQQQTSRQQSEKQFNKQVSRSNRKASSLLKLMELGYPPQVSTIVRKNQLVIHLTLEKLVDLCEVTQHSTIHTDWIYSLMAALREPIEADICSTLRRVARLCISRLHSNQCSIEEEEYTSSLLIICIVRGYFGQTDLV